MRLRIAVGVVLLWPWLAGARDVTVDLRWEYRGLPHGMKVFQPGSERPPVIGETASRAKGQPLPVAQEVPEGRIRFQPGQRRRFVLVYENAGDRPLYFFAAPHHAHPQEHALGLRFRCLCVNEAFKVGPGETWYRVVELQILKGFEGESVTLTHALVGIDAARAARFGHKHAD